MGLGFWVAGLGWGLECRVWGLDFSSEFQRFMEGFWVKGKIFSLRFRIEGCRILTSGLGSWNSGHLAIWVIWLINYWASQVTTQLFTASISSTICFKFIIYIFFYFYKNFEISKFYIFWHFFLTLLSQLFYDFPELGRKFLLTFLRFDPTELKLYIKCPKLSYGLTYF